MPTEPESLISSVLLRDMRAEIGDMRGQMATKDATATKDDISELRSRVADIASDLITTRKDQIVGLRRAVIEYHTSVIGHGVLISDLEPRVAGSSSIST